MIEVKPVGRGAAFEFDVVVRESGSLCRYRVTLEPDLLERLVGGALLLSACFSRLSPSSLIGSPRKQS